MCESQWSRLWHPATDHGVVEQWPNATDHGELEQFRLRCRLWPCASDFGELWKCAVGLSSSLLGIFGALDDSQCESSRAGCGTDAGSLLPGVRLPGLACIDQWLDYPTVFRVLPRVDRHMRECRVQNNNNNQQQQQLRSHFGSSLLHSELESRWLVLP